MRVYFDFNDWWVGVYRGPHHWYICPLPCVVFRIQRSQPKEATRPLWGSYATAKWDSAHPEEEA